VNEPGDEAELFDHARPEHGRTDIGLCHGAVEAVQDQRQRRPAIDELADPGSSIGIEVDRGIRLLALGKAGLGRLAKGSRDLERVDDVQVMRPGLGEVLPWVRARVVADEVRLPVGRRTVGTTTPSFRASAKCRT